jgi:hypothetical protein
MLPCGSGHRRLKMNAFLFAETSAASDWRATLQYPPTTTSTGEMNPVEDPKETKGGDLGDVAASHFPNNAIHAGFLAENSRTLCFPRVVNVS